MKSERRHKLETNILADWLGEKLVGFEQHKTTIAVVFAVGIVLALVALFSLTGSDPVTSAEWTNYFSAFSVSDPTGHLEKLAKDGTANSSATLWGKKTLADRYLARGNQLLFANRKEAVEKLEQAEKLFVDVERGAMNDLQLQEGARFGLGRTYESLGRTEDARKAFDKLAQGRAESPYKKAAEESLKRVQDKRVTETLAWFAEQKPALPAGHPPLGAGKSGLGLGDLPDRPDLTIPGATKAPSSLDEPGDDAPPAKTTPDAPPAENKTSEGGTDK